MTMTPSTRKALEMCRKELISYYKKPDVPMVGSTWQAIEAARLALSAPEAVQEAVADKVLLAACLAHRATHAAEHNPENGKLHGYCIVCGVPWPCDTAASFLSVPSPAQSPSPDAGEAK